MAEALSGVNGAVRGFLQCIIIEGFLHVLLTRDVRRKRDNGWLALPCADAHKMEPEQVICWGK
jgi:hypothetical protein